MPFTRISLLAGHPPAYLEALSESLHAALVESFEVPAADRFQIFHQHQPGELVFDRDYGGGPRSAGFVLFHITTGRARSPAVKRAFYRQLVANLAASPGVRPEDVMVVLSASQLEDWSFANGESAGAPEEEAS